MKIWQYTAWDALLLTLSIMQFIALFALAFTWEESTFIIKSGNFVLLTLMMTYNILIISHLFTHTPWFCAPWLNAIVSILNSINIGQSVTAYRLYHVHNHHLYHNDQKNADGKTNDLSSTFAYGKNNEHASLFHYAFLGALETLVNTGRILLSSLRLWRIGKKEHTLKSLLPRSKDKRIFVLRHLRLERMAHFFGIILFLLISWKWTLFCYLPAFYLALSLVNIQNYYEHFGAMPNNKMANSVSYYGRLYNFITFNDGHHQEHHLRPTAHWHTMPMVRRALNDAMNPVDRIVSPFPAILGFLDKKRKMLHRIAS